MSNDNVTKLIQPGAFDDPLTEILRNGARALLAQAVEAEVAESQIGDCDSLFFCVYTYVFLVIDIPRIERGWPCIPAERSDATHTDLQSDAQSWTSKVGISCCTGSCYPWKLLTEWTTSKRRSGFFSAIWCARGRGAEYYPFRTSLPLA